MINYDEITSHPNWNAQAYRAYLSCESLKNNAKSRESFLEHYLGEWNSEAAYAKEWSLSCKSIDNVPTVVQLRAILKSLSYDYVKYNKADLTVLVLNERGFREVDQYVLDGTTFIRSDNGLSILVLLK